MNWIVRLYKKLRDPVSGLTHAAGLLLSIAGLVLLVTYAALDEKTWHIVSFSIFGTSLILLYGASSLYHLLPVGERGVTILRKIDHIMIYILIAGTYTPVCLVALRGSWGWSLFGIVWGLALGGIVMKLFWMKAPRWLSTVIYLSMGWLVVIAFVPLLQALPPGGILWLSIGGMSYTVGAIIYAIKKPNILPGVFGFHELWHLFVMAGSFSHFWVMLRYILPLE
ncbi:MAG: hemolysin III family protein [Ignavibacteriales bacterium]|nr:hemolysin III family protein [Ignavibacteriales bacterium]